MQTTLSLITNAFNVTLSDRQLAPIIELGGAWAFVLGDHLRVLNDASNIKGPL